MINKTGYAKPVEAILRENTETIKEKTIKYLLTFSLLYVLLRHNDFLNSV